jgi:hypothetical protein
MAKKPETVRCTEEQIARVLDGFEEEMLADFERRNGLKPNSLPRTLKRKAKVLEFPPKLSEQEPLRRQRIIEQDRERLEAQINEQRRAVGLPSLEAARQLRQGLEVASAPQGKVPSNHDPIKLFEDEVRERGND